MSLLEQYYLTLFDPGEYVCWGSTVFATDIDLAANFSSPQNSNKEFICINPLRGPRADANVSAYRNFLIEFDSIPLKEQLRRMAKVPYSACVFSGNKSYHFIISLETPCRSADEYRRLAKRIQRALPGCDRSTSNPSRLSRTPDATRQNLRQQSLKEVRKRITDAELLAWLPPEPVEVQEMVEMPKGYLSSFVRSYLRTGAEPGTRNRTLFAVACEMYRSGYDADQIAEVCKVVNELPLHEFRATIKSAVETAKRDLAASTIKP